MRAKDEIATHTRRQQAIRPSKVSPLSYLGLTGVVVQERGDQRDQLLVVERHELNAHWGEASQLKPQAFSFQAPTHHDRLSKPSARPQSAVVLSQVPGSAIS